MYKKPSKTLIILTLSLSLLHTQAIAENLAGMGETYLYKASIAMSQGERHYYLNEALTLYNNGHYNNKTNLEYMIGLGKTYTMLDDRSNAKNILSQAYNMYPDNSNLHKALADFYSHFQEYNTALEFYKLALSSGYLKDYTTNLLTAQCYERLGDHKNAELYYKVALMLNPNSNLAKERLNSFNNNVNCSNVIIE